MGAKIIGLPASDLISKVRRGAQSIHAQCDELSYGEIGEILDVGKHRVAAWAKCGTIALLDAETVCLRQGWHLDDVWPASIVDDVEAEFAAWRAREAETLEERKARARDARNARLNSRRARAREAKMEGNK